MRRKTFCRSKVFQLFFWEPSNQFYVFRFFSFCILHETKLYTHKRKLFSRKSRNWLDDVLLFHFFLVTKEKCSKTRTKQKPRHPGVPMQRMKCFCLWKVSRDTPVILVTNTREVETHRINILLIKYIFMTLVVS